MHRHKERVVLGNAVTKKSLFKSGGPRKSLQQDNPMFPPTLMRILNLDGQGYDEAKTEVQILEETGSELTNWCPSTILNEIKARLGE